MVYINISINMTTDFGPFIDRESWQARVINEGIFSPTPRTNPVERGSVFSDKIIDQRVSLPAIGALDILTDMREVESWKDNGMVIGVPALSCDLEEEQVVDEEILHTPFVRQDPGFILDAPLMLTREHSKELFDFLKENEQLLRELAEKMQSLLSSK